MPDFLTKIFSADGFMPHGYCLRWDSSLVLLWNAANIGIAIAYFAIPLALLYFVRKRKDLVFSWIFVMFGAFIVACGITHVLKVWTIYHGDYWIEAIVDAWTAVISLATAIVLWPLIPKALSLRSPAELEQANKRLEEEVVARQRSENYLKTSEDALRRHSEDLKVMNEALEIARDRAIEASSVKSAFVANISHELRTPLSAILGMNELLLTTALSDEQKNYAVKIQAAGKSLLTIVNDLLDLSKIESGKMELDCIPLNPHALVKESVKLLHEAANNKGLLLSVELDGTIPAEVLGDSVRLQRVLLNLIGNAVKFTLKGGIEVAGKLETKEEGLAILMFKVTDTGVGISKDDMRLLFQPFSQLDTSTRRRYDGTGLGLSISKRLVELMGGEIGAESEKGKGSTFWFRIPFKLSAEYSAHQHHPNGEAKEGNGVDGIRKAVLVVEDNPVLQEMTLKQLNNLGISAHAVSSAEEALSELANNEYKLILMDCHLPRMDGFEATKLIREAERGGRERTPIVAMTAGAMKGDSERCRDAGMDDYLSKPYTLDDLRKKLKHWLGEM